MDLGVAGSSIRVARMASVVRSERWSVVVRNFYSSWLRRRCSVDAASRFRPRRAVMYVPTPDQKKARKIPTLNVDTVVFDFEDGVAPNQKGIARELIRTTLSTCRGLNSEHVVRLNGIDSGLFRDDLAAVFGGKLSPDVLPDALMLPKVESVDHLRQLELSLDMYSSQMLPVVPLYIIIESPIALLNLRDMCDYGVKRTKTFKLSALVFGSDDFIALLGGTRTPGAVEVLYARQCIVTHAKAFGLDAIDLVDIDYKNLDNLKCQAEEGSRMGFTGKQVIHPNQVPVVQKAFSPSEQQVNWANGLIKAFQENQNFGKGAFEYEGKMIDRPLLLQAQNIIRCHNAILK